jgi:hypothetical protein
MPLRIVLGETQFRALIARRPFIVRIPGGPDFELVLADIGHARLLEAHREAIDKPADPPQAVEFLATRSRGRGKGR